MADKAAGTNTTNLMAVDIGRLGESLQTVFSGIAGVFGALGVPDADAMDAADVSGNVEISVTGSEGKRTSKVQKADSETAENGKGKKGNGAGDEDGSEGGSEYRSENGSKDGPAGKETDGKPEGADVGVLDADHAGVAGDADTGSNRQVTGSVADQSAMEGTKATGSVTADDITKVIVAKIKQDRSNNQKIGALLPAYGVEKVSALKPEQYEAFLTDISQI